MTDPVSQERPHQLDSNTAEVCTTHNKPSARPSANGLVEYSTESHTVRPGLGHAVTTRPVITRPVGQSLGLNQSNATPSRDADVNQQDTIRSTTLIFPPGFALARNNTSNNTYVNDIAHTPDWVAANIGEGYVDVSDESDDTYCVRNSHLIIRGK